MSPFHCTEEGSHFPSEAIRFEIDLFVLNDDFQHDEHPRHIAIAQGDDRSLVRSHLNLQEMMTVSIKETPTGLWNEWKPWHWRRQLGEEKEEDEKEEEENKEEEKGGEEEEKEEEKEEEEKEEEDEEKKKKKKKRKKRRR